MQGVGLLLWMSCEHTTEGANREGIQTRQSANLLLWMSCEHATGDADRERIQTKCRVRVFCCGCHMSMRLGMRTGKGFKQDTECKSFVVDVM